MGVGHKEGEVTALQDEALLASKGTEVPKTVPIAEATRLDDETLLEKGMVLVLVTAEADDDYGLYREFDNGETNGQENEDTAVILGQRVDVSESTDGKVHATAYVKGVFKRDKVIEPEDFDWSGVDQRLIRWPQQD